ncbi:MAG: sigma-70 family RNA polymerase sigma factor [Chloroflexi bacterium]|nr:sigma-70 family RNA polymerase sigma factor [Chloroflexota bacterium]MBK8933188.1 sigma-70 family RNA polymerase sigma factor [Chloroflexota bacterium]MBP6806152.1 sigma-70 family RNA polymerase sigma factor [Chloroflexota bacterium]MBP7592578.1 sigma-70 family RNA polymerase sigma factor [Chloroflexota bacterium]
MVLEPPYTEIDDQALARAALRDAQAFDGLYRRHVTAVYRYCLVHIGHQIEAEEITSQVFLTALETLPSYRGRGPFAAWLMGIARHKCADYHRRQYQNPEVAIDTAVTLTAPNAHPDERIDQARLLDCLRQALRQLSPDRREALQLRFWGGLSVRDTAVAMRRGQSAVKMLVARAISDLQTRCLHDG